MSEILDQPISDQQTYHVQVGLAEYTIACGSQREAVRLARQRLRKEMPHMRGVIDGILDKHFRVDTVSH